MGWRPRAPPRGRGRSRAALPFPGDSKLESIEFYILCERRGSSAMESSLLRHGSLALLVAQDTALVLLMRYSRQRSGSMYISSTAVCSMEVMKLSVCFLMLLCGEAHGSFGMLVFMIRKEVLGRPKEVAKLALPALLYLIQNNLLYFALSHLQATPYKVTYNLKILTSAFFSVTLLGQRLGRRRWISLVVLFLGVTIVQTDNPKNELSRHHSGLGSQTLGFVAVGGAAITSGFSGVYQQRILQSCKTDMWIRNVQMGVTSVTLGFLCTFLKDRQAIADGGFFQGYSRLVWVVVSLQALGGLNVAFILKYADNILKGFAAAFSTIASCIIEMVLFQFRPSPLFLFGSALINIAAYFYNTPATKRPTKCDASALHSV